MDKHTTATRANDVKGRSSPGFFGSVPLYFIVAFSFFVGIAGLFDDITLYRARTWPAVEARLDHCDIALHASKSRFYWRVSADWSFGANHEHRYSDEWTPRGAPEYARHDPKSDSASERAAVFARYCNETTIGKLRVSPGGTVRPDDKVTGATLVTDVCIEVFFLLLGSAFTAGLVYDRSRKSRRKRRR